MKKLIVFLCAAVLSVSLILSCVCAEGAPADSARYDMSLEAYETWAENAFEKVNDWREGSKNLTGFPLQMEAVIRMLDEFKNNSSVLEKGEYYISWHSEALKVAFDERMIGITLSVEFGSEDNRLDIDVLKSVDWHNGELWFDGHQVTTNARNIEVQMTETEAGQPGICEITAGRDEDHLLIRMTSGSKTAEFIVALPDNSKAAYIGITGENCRIREIKVKQTGEELPPGSVRKIVSKVSFTDRLESDLPNVQIDHSRSAATKGIPIRDEVVVDFHTMSLPSANLVWHCPYIVLFYAEDGIVGGESYKEFALIKINGETTGNEWFAANKLVTKTSDDFPGWDVWKNQNKAGMECSVRFVRRGSKIITSTENLGVSVENTTTVFEKPEAVYAALTGDQVALTDIRVS